MIFESNLFYVYSLATCWLMRSPSSVLRARSFFSEGRDGLAVGEAEALTCQTRSISPAIITSRPHYYIESASYHQSLT